MFCQSLHPVSLCIGVPQLLHMMCDAIIHTCRISGHGLFFSHLFVALPTVGVILSRLSRRSFVSFCTHYCWVITRSIYCFIPLQVFQSDIFSFQLLIPSSSLRVFHSHCPSLFLTVSLLLFLNRDSRSNYLLTLTLARLSLFSSLSLSSR